MSPQALLIKLMISCQSNWSSVEGGHELWQSHTVATESQLLQHSESSQGRDTAEKGSGGLVCASISFVWDLNNRVVCAEWSAAVGFRVLFTEKYGGGAPWTLFLFIFPLSLLLCFLSSSSPCSCLSSPSAFSFFSCFLSLSWLFPRPGSVLGLQPRPLSMRITLTAA